MKENIEWKIKLREEDRRGKLKKAERVGGKKEIKKEIREEENKEL